MTVTAKTMDVAKLYTVQIASYRSEQEASAGWQALATEQADLLAKLPHAVAKADLGAEKGVFYRLQAGSFSDRKEAKALCSDLKNHSIDCMVVEATPADGRAGLVPAVDARSRQLICDWRSLIGSARNSRTFSNYPNRRSILLPSIPRSRDTMRGSDFFLQA